MMQKKMEATVVHWVVFGVTQGLYRGYIGARNG